MVRITRQSRPVFFRFLSIPLAILVIVQPVSTSLIFAQSATQGNNSQGDDNQGQIVVPPSSQDDQGQDAGQNAHTNHVIFVSSTPLATGGIPGGENPGSLACVYNLVNPALNPGCSRTPSSFINASGGSGTIAIVDAYDYPTAATDLAAFSTQFGLPGANFQVVYATGVQPATNCGWNQEAALDIEWAHAMAPAANIVLVEAASSSFADLLVAVDAATRIVQTGSTGTGQVSMSWGGNEFNGETQYDSHFNGAGVAYFAAAGDSGGKTNWPGVSPNVISAGGTRVNRSSAGAFQSETAWSKEICGGGSCGGGGGPSRYERRPTYQNAISSIVGSVRGTPDFSFDADPYSGVAVFEDSPACTGSNAGWMVFGGTSVATPSLAGIVNLAGKNQATGSSSRYAEQTQMYTGYNAAGYYGVDFRDITSGSTGYSAKTGWDFATGIGSDLGLSGK